MGNASKGPMFGRDIGIDLGSSSCLVCAKGQGLVLQEPSLAAADKQSGSVLALGAEAEHMLSHTPGDLVALRPLRSGIISDYAMTERMLRDILQKTSASRVFKPRLLLGLPLDMTEVEARALVDAGLQAGAKSVGLLSEPLAAALGAGLDIGRADGIMVLDMGAAKTQIAVLSLSAVVESLSLKAGGDQFDEALAKYIRRSHNVLIGERIAEEIKRSIGCVLPRPSELSLEVKGRSLHSSLPETLTLTSGDMVRAFEALSAQILEGVQSVLEHTPPELSSDIARHGIVLTGGGSRLYGLDQLIQKHTGISTHLLDEPEKAIALGLSKALEDGFSVPDDAKRAPLNAKKT